MSFLDDQTDEKLRGIDKIAQIGHESGPDQDCFAHAHREEDKVGDVDDNGYGAAYILPEKLGCEHVFVENIFFKECSGNEYQDKD